MEQRTIALSIDGPAIAKPEKIAESNKRKRLNLEHELADSEMEEYEKNKDAINKKDNARNADSQSRIQSSVKKGALVTLLIAIVIFTEYQSGKGVPLPADHVRQIEFWDEQEKKKIQASWRKIWYTDLQGNVKLSPRVHSMKSRGTSAAVAADRKAAGYAQKSATNMGHDQLNALEGCAIHLLLAHIKKVLGDEAWAEWSFEPVFDGLQADLMARHTSFPEGMYVPIQIKSAQIEFGNQTNYHLKGGQYETWMYCIAIGVRNYVLVEPESVDDNDVPSAEIYEVWDLGVCANLQPYPAIAYGSVETAKRCFFMHNAKDYAKPEDFILQMMKNIKNWGEEKMFTRHKILYDMEVVNKKITPKKIPEVLGLTELAKVLTGLKPPWRHCTYGSKYASAERTLPLVSYRMVCSMGRTCGLNHVAFGRPRACALPSPSRACARENTTSSVVNFCSVASRNLMKQDTMGKSTASRVPSSSMPTRILLAMVQSASSESEQS